LRFAQSRNIPTFIHESNSFAGKSNILLGKKATQIFTASDNMDTFFPANKIVKKGNPVRQSITQSQASKNGSLKFLGLQENKKTVLVVGGSLGAKSINEAINKNIDAFAKNNLQLIWQTGKPYFETAAATVKGHNEICMKDFITQMEYAYGAADVVISRSGAMAVAELCLVKKPVIFVPYPHAAEDHQTANANALVEKNAALMVKDADAENDLVNTLLKLIADDNLQNELKNNISTLAIKNADEIIASKVLLAIQ
jgi:UDP-N-acetylglucosamine--N-acetylmuramyl-(pentapeptide) pyrophosphoryl-undecaprenol N-acetylglucosamine transferase